MADIIDGSSNSGVSRVGALQVTDSYPEVPLYLWL